MIRLHSGYKDGRYYCPICRSQLLKQNSQTLYRVIQYCVNEDCPNPNTYDDKGLVDEPFIITLESKPSE